MNVWGDISLVDTLKALCRMQQLIVATIVCARTDVCGFTGESMEDSVAREVGEEVGLDVSCVQYLCSQHWPHPAPRLMLGCVATACSNEVKLI